MIRGFWGIRGIKAGLKWERYVQAGCVRLQPRADISLGKIRGQAQIQGALISKNKVRVGKVWNERVNCNNCSIGCNTFPAAVTWAGADLICCWGRQLLTMKARLPARHLVSISKIERSTEL